MPMIEDDINTDQIAPLQLAKGLSDAMPLHDPKALVDLLDEVEAAGADEFIVVPATSDPAMLDELARVVADRR
ncbi:MAG: hypothetical protein EBY80_09880 [Actinobacteria bacterium]|nr:hypothetical protein [Actinomycetota bacterium]